MNDGTLKITCKNALPLYSLIQILYWSIYGLMFPFASVFLQDRGFSNSHIGLVLGFAYTMSALLQPAIASIFSRFNVRLSSGLMGIYAAVAVLAVCLLVLPLPNMLLAVLVVAAFSLHSSAQPSINSLAHAFDAAGVPVNFGFARALGSVGFAILTSIMGTVMNHVSPRFLPAFYLALIILLFLTLGVFRTPVSVHEEKENEKSQGSFVQKYPAFMMFLAGILCICLNHTLIDTFMLQVLQNIGGGAQELGVAVSLAAMSEVPVMMLYSRLRKKLGVKKLLILCGWAWCLKNAITAFATAPFMVYGAQILQALGYAIYVPLTVDLVAMMLPEKDFLKGQSLAGSAYTFGGVFAAFTSGMMLDHFGVNATLTFMLLFSLAGAVLFTTAALSRRKNA